MNTANDRSAAKTPRRYLKRIVAVAVTGITLSLGAYAWANNGLGTCQHGWMSGKGAHGDPNARVDFVLQHIYGVLDASEAQQAQIDPLVRQALADLMPLRSELQNGRQQAISLLKQTTIDRAAVEAVRAQQMQVADTASKRISQLLVDVAEVLTPQQRQALADQIEKRIMARHGRMHG